jgi:hypothetical protein
MSTKTPAFLLDAVPGILYDVTMMTKQTSSMMMSMDMMPMRQPRILPMRPAD